MIERSRFGPARYAPLRKNKSKKISKKREYSILKKLYI